MKRIWLISIIISSVIGLALFLKQPSASELLKSGEAQYKKGNLKEATEDLKKSANANPRSFKAHYLLGKSFEGLGDINKAIEHIKKASLITNNAEVHYNLAILYRENKELNKAIMRLQEALSFDPNFIGAKIILAKVYDENKQYKEAIQTYNELLKSIAPLDKNQLRLELANTYWSNKEPEKAYNEINKLLKEDPDNKSALAFKKTNKWGLD